MREGTPKSWPAATYKRLRKEKKEIAKSQIRDSQRKAKASERAWQSMPDLGRTRPKAWIPGAPTEPPQKRVKGSKPGLSDSAGPYFKPKKQ